MGLYDDYKSILKADLENKTILDKTVYVIAVIALIFSLGSISDAAFGFKGFIVNFIDSYRLVVHWPIEYLSKFMTIKLNPNSIDWFVMFGLVYKVGNSLDKKKMSKFPWLLLGVIFLAAIGYHFVGYIEVITYVILSIPIGVAFGIWLSERSQPKAKEFLIKITSIYLTLGVIAAISEGLFRVTT